MKKKISILLFGLFVFVIAGVTNVKADASFKNASVVCVPDEIDFGETSKCYVIGQLTDGNMYAAYTEAMASQLTIKDVGTRQDINAYRFGTNSPSPTMTSQMYTCNQSTAEVNGFKPLGCAAFESKAQATPNIKSSISFDSSSYTGFTEIGYYEVALADTATKNNCGVLCIQVQYALTYKAKTTDAEDITFNATAGGSSTAQKYNMPSYACSEISPKISGTVEEENEPTGSFASYTVLIAGACIAIAAIAIASKHNKIYKV